MKKLTIVLGVLLILAVGALPALAITWGEPDGDRHPHVGLVIFDDEDGPAWRCTGTLISPTVFLTAGHCTDGAVAARVWFDSDLATNDEYPFGGVTSIEAAEIRSHPDYNWGPQSNPHDVGILILAEEPTDIEPANLPEELDIQKDRVCDPITASAKVLQFYSQSDFAGSEWETYTPNPSIDTQNGIKFLLSWFPFIVLIISFIGLLFYPIKGDRLKENQKRLAELHAKKRENNHEFTS